MNVLNTLPHSMHMYILTWHMAIKILTNWVLDFFWNLKGHYTHPMFLLKSGGHQTLILFLLTDWLTGCFIQCYSLFQTDSLCFSHTPLCMTDCSFTQCILNIHQSAVVTALLACYMAGATSGCCHTGVYSAYTIHQCTSLQFILEYACIEIGIDKENLSFYIVLG